MKKLLLLGMLAATAAQAADLNRYVGYTIAAKKTIVGYVDADGKRKDTFEGCNFGRRIVFDDRTYLTCSEFGYQYSYRPDAILLVRNGSWKMVVEGSEYDMRN